MRARARSPAVASDRFSSTNGTTSAIVASATRSRWRARAGWPGPSSAAASLCDDAGAAQLRERIGGGSRGHDGAVGQLVSGTVMVGDDHVQTERPGVSHLLDRRDPAVHREDERARRRPRGGQSCRPRCRSPPRTETAGATSRRRRAHAASAPPARWRRCRRRRSRRARRSGRPGRPLPGCAPPPRSCRRAGTDRAAARSPSRKSCAAAGILVAAADEHACRHLAHPELGGETAHRSGLTVSDRPAATVHRTIEGTPRAGQTTLRKVGIRSRGSRRATP